MTVYIPKSLLSDSAAEAGARLGEVRRRLDRAETQAHHYKRLYDANAPRLEGLRERAADAPLEERYGLQRQLQRAEVQFAEWESADGKVWAGLKKEINELTGERDQLERFLADFVGIAARDA